MHVLLLGYLGIQKLPTKEQTRKSVGGEQSTRVRVAYTLLGPTDLSWKRRAGRTAQMISVWALKLTDSEG